MQTSESVTRNTHTQCPLTRVGQNMKKRRFPAGELPGTPASHVDALPTKGAMKVRAGGNTELPRENAATSVSARLKTNKKELPSLLCRCRQATRYRASRGAGCRRAGNGAGRTQLQ